MSRRRKRQEAPTRREPTELEREAYRQMLYQATLTNSKPPPPPWEPQDELRGHQGKGAGRPSGAVGS